MTKVVSMTPDEIVAEIQSSVKPSKTLADFAEEALVPQGIEVPKPESVFALDGISVFSKKSLSTLIGKAKSGKTTAIAWIVAQILKLGLKVLWFDTEQGRYYSSRTQHWILAMYGYPKCENLLLYDLKVHDPAKRIEMIELLIQQQNPDLVILDGIRDLVYDINDPKESTNTLQNVMRWAEEYDCHVCTILHQNKGNEHARGHLGTELINKSETVIKVEPDAGNKNITVCSPEFTRGEPFKDFAFERDSAGMPQLVNDYQPDVTTKGESKARRFQTLPIQIDSVTHYAFLKKAFNGQEEICYSDLWAGIGAAFGSAGMDMLDATSKKYVTFYTQQGYVLKTDKKGKYQYYKIQIKSHPGSANKMQSNCHEEKNDSELF